MVTVLLVMFQTAMWTRAPHPQRGENCPRPRYNMLVAMETVVNPLLVRSGVLTNHSTRAFCIVCIAMAIFYRVLLAFGHSSPLCDNDGVRPTPLTFPSKQFRGEGEQGWDPHLSSVSTSVYR